VDLVHCNFLYTLPLCLTVARRLRVPVVVSVREPVAGGVRGAAYGRLLRRAACVGFMSAHQRHAYERRRFVAPGAPVIANGIDVAWFRPPTDSERAEARLRCDLSPDRLAVVYLGRIDPVKGIETLLTAMSPLPDPRMVVLVAGGVTPWRHHERYARRLAASAAPGVRFIGRDDDPRRLLWAADVVVVPSLWEEPLARSALEAMACGVPVVASRNGGLPEILHGALGELLFAPGDPAALLEALRRALPELGGTRRWNASVRDAVVGQFSLGATTEALDGLFRRAIDGQRPRAADRAGSVDV
jgi:glycosyltransferase involved in cell wall biosynthesis